MLTTTLTLPFPSPGGASRYATPESLRRSYDDVVREIEGQPGVRRVALGGVLPLDGGWFSQPFDIAGAVPRPDGQKPIAPYHMVSPTYFATLAIPIVSGRAFPGEDTGGGTPVCIVSEAFVQQHLAGRAPIGMRVAVPMMAFGPSGIVEREIVGVARQVKGQPDEPMAQAQIYVPLAQNTWWMASLHRRARLRTGRGAGLDRACRGAPRRPPTGRRRGSGRSRPLRGRRRPGHASGRCS